MKKQPAKQTITIQGEIKSIRYRNPESGWAIFTVELSEDFEQYQNRNHELFFNSTCTGILPEFAAQSGMKVACEGFLEINPKFGKQLKCYVIIPEAPTVKNEAGVLKLLQRIPGIGTKKAEQAISEHGYRVAWKLALTDPEKIGVPPRQSEQAMDTAKSLIGGFDCLVYLLSIGCTDRQANKIMAHFETADKAEKAVKENPYVLIDIDGFGFLTVDQIALKSGVDLANNARIHSAIKFVLEDSETNQGNTYLYGKKLIAITMELLKKNAMKMALPLGGLPVYDDVRAAVYSMDGAGKIVIHADTGRVFSKKLLNCEKVILQAAGGESWINECGAGGGDDGGCGDTTTTENNDNFNSESVPF